MKEIIEAAEKICAEYQKEKAREGLDYNNFSMLDIERREMKTHEYMIYAIMKDEVIGMGKKVRNI